MRIDFYIWTVRYFGSRSKATNACKNGNVMINGEKVKPSHHVLIDDVISIKKKQMMDIFTVLNYPKSRVGSKLVDLYRMKNEIPAHKKLRDKSNHSRKKGEGRPTKKERRSLDEFLT